MEFDTHIKIEKCDFVDKDTGRIVKYDRCTFVYKGVEIMFSINKNNKPLWDFLVSQNQK